ncbi:MAG: type III secretion system outer membrane ring subunit SctC [Granulosicoccaceae bacterium]
MRIKIKTKFMLNPSKVLQTAVLTFVIGSVGIAHSAPLPPMVQQVSINAREIGVDQFLQQLFGQIGIPVTVDNRVEGTVNGVWKDSASGLLKQALKSFQLVAYYDGAMAYVYNDRDVSQEMLSVQPDVAKRIRRQVEQLGLPDVNNRLRLVGDNGLQVIGTPRFVQQIKEVSVSIRSTKKQYKPQVVERLYHLKHAWAQDTNMEIGGELVPVQGMVSILNELLVGAPIGDTSVAGFADGGIDGLSTIPKENQLISINAGNKSTDGIASPQIKSSSLVRRVSARSMSAENVRIVAVSRLNAVLIRDYENHMASYESLINALDVEPYMLEIEATIIDINADSRREIGVNWRAQDDRFNDALVGNGSVSDQLLRPNTAITPQGNGGILSLALGNQRAKFLARIRALEDSGDAEIISKPHVVTLSNVEALLDTTQSYFVRVAAKEDASLFKITVGTTLRVTPHVYKSGDTTKIKLMVNIQDGATTDSQVDAIPVIGQSTINTQAIVTAGDSLLVGGMVRESKRSGESKVPFLGDIPGLGSIFRTRTRSNNKVERLFLITPRLAYRKGFAKRMEAPVLEGKISDIVRTSSLRLDPPTGPIQEDSVVRPGQEQPQAINPITRPDPSLQRRRVDGILVIDEIKNKLNIPPAPEEPVKPIMHDEEGWSVVAMPAHSFKTPVYHVNSDRATATKTKIYRTEVPLANDFKPIENSITVPSSFSDAEAGVWQEVGQ